MIQKNHKDFNEYCYIIIMIKKSKDYIMLIKSDFELFYNDRESISNDSSKGILIVISLAHEGLCIRKMSISTIDMLYLTRMIR
jgi:hypothetical protein